MVRRSASSQDWLRERRQDPYVKAARKEGFRSRAAFKLREIHERIPGGLIRPGMTVIDLGAAPGGWSQVAAPLAGPRGRVVAVDLLEIPPLTPPAGSPDSSGANGPVTILRGDFLEASTLNRLMDILEGRGIDLVLSDMAPNMSGVRVVDQARGELLAESAFQFAAEVLRPKGSAVVKLFQGPGFHELVQQARRLFEKVKVVKPNASRSRSPENYLVCAGFRAGPDGPEALPRGGG